jgi:hypothetical protein
MNDLTQTSDVYLCGHCGSLSLELPSLIDGIATCNGCGWKGPTRDLVVKTFRHVGGSDEEIIRKFMREFRLTLAKDFSGPLAKLLFKWGFVGEEELNGQIIISVTQMKRYLTAIFQASVSAIIQTREDIEKERVNERSV